MVDDLNARVRAILTKDWDPVGVGNEPKAADEYDDYVPAVVAMIRTRTSVDAIGEYLLTVERRKMGLAGDATRARSVAAALLRSFA